MAFQQGLSGLNAAARNLDVIGNNVANSSTVGFKTSQAIFADVYANSLAGSGSSTSGSGVNVAGVKQKFSQGNITATNNPLDIAINGSGFFRLSDNGAISYSRNGQFQTDKNGFLVNADGKSVTGYTVNAAGVVNTGVLTNLKISSADLVARATAKAGALVNLDSRAASLPSAGFKPIDPATYSSSTSVAVYDSLGNSHTLSSYFVKTAANAWDVFATVDGTQVGAGALGKLAFNSDGTLNAAGSTLPITVTAPVATGASALSFALDFTGSTQFGSGFGVNALNQNGYASGRLAGFNIAADGSLLGRYTNGQSSVLGQIALANFANPQGLQPLGGNGWSETSDSGAPVVGAPTTGALGLLQSAAVEESSVDLTAELVNLITAQRAYQANAQTIKTQDAVLQTLVNLR